MQLNKVLKGLMLALPMLAVAACSSKKGNDKTSAENNVADSNASLTAEQLASQQMQELQSNNIVYFGFDKYDVTPEYAQLLDQHATFFLRGNPSVKITVEGHTDEKGTPEYNIALGERRANAVKIYLQSKGVNGEQIAIVSYGKEKPAIQGNDESAYAKNRRAILVY
ncbi:Peptidoglycan-associated lipoprotein [Arsenophonus endosymbiont of Aleurodicus floccissimus]|uniref:peptidoglycan-associated lipoprotein Pal n=1 Tax=Arsenophonus endosymbiont of Aleurodicus floccissimus TaxID=2152761 RepID=UPI000E6B2DD8|nr:peptidoglycan-associated lipoprotein Pal [Arsenophonus endosymbiont of Aleurodicus floccissimus]SPP30964.1 Peptidoglycan-associated lipoprotein [Arsenophonus endosymbiont of Aleurodicus floccissimus]